MNLRMRSRRLSHGQEQGCVRASTRPPCGSAGDADHSISAGAGCSSHRGSACRGSRDAPYPPYPAPHKPHAPFSDRDNRSCRRPSCRTDEATRLCRACSSPRSSVSRSCTNPAGWCVRRSDSRRISPSRSDAPSPLRRRAEARPGKDRGSVRRVRICSSRPDRIPRVRRPGGETLR